MSLHCSSPYHKRQVLLFFYYRRIKVFSKLSPLLSVAMDSASVYVIQVFADALPPHAYHRPPSRSTSLSPTLVNNPMTPTFYHSSSPSAPVLPILSTLKSSTQPANPFTPSQAILSVRLWNCARTTSRSRASAVQRDRSSPRMVFRRKKRKCRYWLPGIAPENECVSPSR